MLSRGNVHSIGGKEIGCCWSDPSCSITAVPGPALTLTFSRGQPTVTDRPHCESFNSTGWILEVGPLEQLLGFKLLLLRLLPLVLG